MGLIVVEDTVDGNIYSRELDHPAGTLVAATVWQNGFLVIGATVSEVSDTKVRITVQNGFPAQVRLLIDVKSVEIPASDAPAPRRLRPARKRRSNGKD